MTSIPKSALIIECGALVTTATLIESNEQTYCIAGRAEAISTWEQPWSDITVGAVDAVRRLESDLTRRLLDEAESPLSPRTEQGDGVDCVVTLVGAATPLSVGIVGLTNQISLSRAKHALTATYAVPSLQLSADGGPALLSSAGVSSSEGGASLAGWIESLQGTPPDAILLTGGIEAGAADPILDLAHLIAIALQGIPPATRPEVIFAGNSRLQSQVKTILGELTTVVVMDNIGPNWQQTRFKRLQAEINRRFVQKKLPQIPGFKRLASWGQGLVTPTARSLAETIHYIGQQYQVRVLGVDIDSAAVTMAARQNRRYSSTIRADLGLGLNISTLLEQVSWENFERWLPFNFSRTDFRNFAMNRVLYPHAVPQTDQESWLLLALVREAMRLVSRQAGQVWSRQDIEQADWFGWDLILAMGQPLTRLIDPRMAALALLDGLEPVGICRLALDRWGTTRLMGGLARVQPDMSARLVGQTLRFSSDGPLLNLGMVIAPVGVGVPGEPVMQLEIIFANQRRVRKKITFGTVTVIPLAAHEEVTLNVYPSRHFSLNPNAARGGKAVYAKVNGGLLGLIIDARGRPILLDTADAARQAQLQSWMSALSPQPEMINVPQTQVTLEPA